ncbi:DUF4192 domain-containing protein [Kitasatospora purpeofusca]|uniref:DUF4192 domain-containing protein n=1 Tax=Kitasatospora purpeofusca TaxID=67352 RepID=UPI002A59F805|nr:DUF4192 family protein [Kitasatospora purpeofusca]MDY0813153.1 DUF4192 family protein [Kitasatospora purpeofusca]
MTNEHIALPFGDGPGGRSLTMRGPADMAEALPYLLGFFPDDSIVAVGLQPPGLHQGGVIRLDIPEATAEWPSAAEETAALMVQLSERQARRPVQVLLYLCQDPAVRGPGREHGPPVAERLRPLAERLRESFESRGVRVKESLCVSAGRWWSYLCTREGCCDPGGHPIRREPGPGPVAVAATVAGLAPRGSRKEILAGLAPIGPPGAESARAALARAGAGPGALPGGRRPLDRREGARLLDTAVAEFLAGAVSLDDDRAARLLLALQDRVLRDRAAEYARPGELAPTRRLWTFLATRCVAPHERLAAPPLTLLAWVSWVAGDAATARVVLGHTLRRTPGYLLAQLLYESMNGGFAPEALLTSIEEERRRRTERERAEGEAAAEPEAAPDPPPGPDLDGAPGPGNDPAGGGAVEPGPGGAEAGPPARGKARRGRRRRGRPVAGSPPADTPPGPASRTADSIDPTDPTDSTDPTDTAESSGQPAGPDGIEHDGVEHDGVGRAARPPGTTRSAGGGSTPPPPSVRAAVLPGVRRRRGACGAERGQRRAR